MKKTSRVIGTIAALGLGAGLALAGPVAANASTGQSAATASAVTPLSGDCKWRNAVGPIGGGWSGASTGCNYIGTTKNTTVTYVWTKTSDTESCVQGKGFNALTAPVWQSAGCGDGGSTTILWGNVAGAKQVKVKSLAVATGSTINWE
ncbi:hypothetical protein AAEP80_12515 [Curtobacterium sp. L3-7]|jgi:hypothetical protein|uniref:hypothetical protein n=1 Tax=unclassified Curtobacterium TaxID=257496 RepID=UPI0007D73480|nr:hypothetical protein [Curtobacterium sp. 9128]SBN63495.1 hypothetical protein GA0004736_2430 [Curtobacterium sp. 9128]